MPGGTSGARVPERVDRDHLGPDALGRRLAGVGGRVLGRHPHPMRDAPADEVADRMADDPARTTAADLNPRVPAARRRGRC